MDWGSVAKGALAAYVAFDAFKRAARSRERRRLGDAEQNERGKGGIRSKLHNVHNIDQRVAHIVKLAQKGRTDPEIVQLARQTVSKRCGNMHCIPERAYGKEVAAVFHEVRQRVRYVRDAWGVDQFSSARRILEAGGGDCFPKGTLVLRDDHALVPIEDIHEGDRIWGLGDWSEVTRAWGYKGELPFDAIKLNNGSWLHLTPDHKVFVAHCDRHVDRTTSPPCACPISERRVERMRVADLQMQMVLLAPSRLPFGAETMDPDRAYVEGLYISDGDSDKNHRFRIAGQDGCPKEEQKKQVQAICERLGIPTRWARKYITVKDKIWALRMHQMGRRAAEKRVISINLDEGAAGALLRGIMADSGANTSGDGRTFTTTSRLLATQTRVLHRMFGVSCGYSYIENHGGLGENPIHRLSTRARTDGKNEKLLRVKEIVRGISTGAAYDITTEDHYVYLPEHDVTVSQCDDYSILIASMLGALGYPVRLRVIRTVDSPEWNHIYNMVGLPPGNPTKWIPLDASVSEPPGWQAPRSQIAEIRDYEVP
jgi:hypothetical protein